MADNILSFKFNSTTPSLSSSGTFDVVIETTNGEIICFTVDTYESVGFISSIQTVSVLEVTETGINMSRIPCTQTVFEDFKDVTEVRELSKKIRLEPNMLVTKITPGIFISKIQIVFIARTIKKGSDSSKIMAELVIPPREIHSSIKLEVQIVIPDEQSRTNVLCNLRYKDKFGVLENERICNF